MGCANCNDDCKWNIIHVCRVCELLDNDTSIKRVCYCNDCGAYICKEDWDNMPRRAIAFGASVIEKVTEAVSEIFTRVKRKRINKEFPTDEFGKEDESKLNEPPQTSA